jgi:predicted ATPase with chaperone activity
LFVGFVLAASVAAKRKESQGVRVGQELKGKEQLVLQTTVLMKARLETIRARMERQRLVSENETPKSELNKARASLDIQGEIVGKSHAAANTEDMSMFVHCSAAVIEEMIGGQPTKY